MDLGAAFAMDAIVAFGRIHESGPSVAGRSFRRGEAIDDERSEVTMEPAWRTDGAPCFRMPPEEQTFERAVTSCYEPLYRFALGLSRSEADAADLTQRAFERFGEKSGALRDPSKAKTWLFTTLYRDFLQQRRHATRFPESEIDEAIESTVVELPRAEVMADANAAVAALHRMEEPFRSALILFYLQDHSYRDIAEILDVPIGTVMSRLSRGKEMLREQLVSNDIKAAAVSAGRGAVK